MNIPTAKIAECWLLIDIFRFFNTVPPKYFTTWIHSEQKESLASSARL